MEQIHKQVELWVLKVQLNIRPDWEGNYFKRIEPDLATKINDYHAQEFTTKDYLFSALNPAYYNFDYRRPIEVWRQYNE